jgi:hypothetical protein
MTGSGSALLCQTFGVENAQRAYIDEGFVVLVHVGWQRLAVPRYLSSWLLNP